MNTRKFSPVQQHRPASNGFTLIEVVVALAIFALISVGASTALSLSLSAKEQSQQISALHRALTVTRSIMRDDLLQVVLRPTREPYGGTPLETFDGGQLADASSLLVFTRRGWINPGGRATRGNIQHVEYRFEEGALIRRTRARLDPGPETDIYDQVLMEGLSSVSLEFKLGRSWTRSVRISRLSNTPLPNAVAMITTDPVHGEMRHLFMLRGEPF